MRKYAVALMLASVFGWGAAPAQERACLHGPSETAVQAARRRAALEFARLINTTELRAHSQAQAYYALGDLHTIPAPPDGFKAQLSSDGTFAQTRGQAVRTAASTRQGRRSGDRLHAAAGDWVRQQPLRF